MVRLASWWPAFRQCGPAFPAAFFVEWQPVAGVGEPVFLLLVPQPAPRALVPLAEQVPHALVPQPEPHAPHALVAPLELVWQAVVSLPEQASHDLSW